MPEFDLIQYIERHSDDVNWKMLSKSQKLNDVLKWDKILFSEQRWIINIQNLLENKNYYWDFTALSRLDSINYHSEILSIRTEEWDWHYLTEFSTIFDRGKFFKINFYKFKKHIDFDKLSTREGSGVNQKLIQDNIDISWNWSALSKNTSIKFDIAFIKKQKSKPWDWQALSARTDIKLDNDSLYSLIDKNWDWQQISSNQNIVFDEMCILKLSNKPLNWFLVSQNSNFIPNQKTLSFLRGKDIDWIAISKNKNLDESVIWDYKELLHWE